MDIETRLQKETDKKNDNTDDLAADDLYNPANKKKICFLLKDLYEPFMLRYEGSFQLELNYCECLSQHIMSQTVGI